MKLLLLLIAVPLVMGGGFEEMWKGMVEKLAAEGDNKGWGAEQGWGAEHGNEGWGAEHGNEGWGAEHGNEGWGPAPGGQNGTDEHDRAFAEFTEWLKSQKKHDESKEEYMQYMKRNMENYKDYSNAKYYKEKQEAKRKEYMDEKRDREIMKEMLGSQLHMAYEEYEEEKKEFKFGIASHFLNMCKCRVSGSRMLNRLHSGEFGHRMDASSSTNSTSSSSTSVVVVIRNCTNGVCTNTTTQSHQSSQTTIQGVVIRTAEEEAHLLLEADQEDRVDHVWADLTDVMCNAAGEYMEMLRELEESYAVYLDEGPPQALG